MTERCGRRQKMEPGRSSSLDAVTGASDVESMLIAMLHLPKRWQNLDIEIVCFFIFFA